MNQVDLRHGHAKYGASINSVVMKSLSHLAIRASTINTCA